MAEKKKLSPFQRKLVRAQERAVPFISVSTQDTTATLSQILVALPPGMPLLTWDISTGLGGIGENGESFAEWFNSRINPDDMTGAGGFRECVLKLRENEQDLPEKVFALAALNLHRAMEDASVVQTISNLRQWLAQGEELRGQQRARTLLFLSPSFTFPAEISQDIYSLEDSPPDTDRLVESIKEIAGWASVPLPSESKIVQGAEALLSLSEFSARQEISLALENNPDWIDGLGERRRIKVNATPGLEMFGGKTTFADIGGYSEIKSFLSSLFGGPMGFRSIFFIDEIEKALGSMNDSSGVSLRMLGTILSHISDTGVSGILLHGVPGAGKTAVSQASSGEFKVPFISADLSAMQNSLVGKSEENLRRALEIDKSLGRGKSLWIATCNEIERIPAPLLSRFDLGTFTFDLPSNEELSTIWPIQLQAHSLDVSQPLPDSQGWTGREIKGACKKAFALGLSVVEAAKYVIPLSVSSPQVISKCHQEADGKLLSASYPGAFRMSTRDKNKKGMAINVDKEGSPSMIIVNASPGPFQFSPSEQEAPLPKKARIGFGEEPQPSQEPQEGESK